MMSDQEKQDLEDFAEEYKLMKKIKEIQFKKIDIILLLFLSQYVFRILKI